MNCAKKGRRCCLSITQTSSRTRFGKFGSILKISLKRIKGWFWQDPTLAKDNGMLDKIQRCYEVLLPGAEQEQKKRAHEEQMIQKKTQWLQKWFCSPTCPECRAIALGSFGCSGCLKSDKHKPSCCLGKAWAKIEQRPETWLVSDRSTRKHRRRQHMVGEGKCEEERKRQGCAGNRRSDCKRPGRRRGKKQGNMT